MRGAYEDLWHAQHACDSTPQPAAAAAAGGAADGACSGVEYDGAGRYVLMFGGATDDELHFGHAAFARPAAAAARRRRAQSEAVSTSEWSLLYNVRGGRRYEGGVLSVEGNMLSPESVAELAALELRLIRSAVGIALLDSPDAC